MARKINGLSSKLKQDERINAEIQRLSDILKNIHESKKSIAKEHIKNIAFMSVTLEDLQEVIKSQGPIIRFEQGAQKLTIENPAQKSYNTMIARFTAENKLLIDLLPKDLPDIIPVQQANEDDKPKDALQAFQDKYKK